MQKYRLGVGLVEFIIILIVIAIAAMELFERYGRQMQDSTATLAQEISGSSLEQCEVPTNNPPVIVDQDGLEYTYDPRVDRYRHRRNGRFVRKVDIRVCP